jgi:uncharacterized membrane protein
MVKRMARNTVKYLYSSSLMGVKVALFFYLKVGCAVIGALLSRSEVIIDPMVVTHITHES